MPNINPDAPDQELIARAVENIHNGVFVANIAQILFARNKFSMAINLLLQYPQITKEFDYLVAICKAYYALKDYANAMIFNDKAMLLKKDADILMMRGHITKRKSDYKSSELSYIEAIGLTNDAKLLADLYDFLGHVQIFQLKFAEAQSNYQKALSYQPNHKSAIIHIVNGLNRAGQYKESYEKGIFFAQKYGDAPLMSINIAMSLMSCGHFTQAWEYFKHRFETPYYSAFKRPYHCPIWQGESLLGKKLIIQAEQGIGDQLIFSGFLRHLPKDCTIYYACEPRFKDLFAFAFSHITMIPEFYDKEAQAAKEFNCDYYIPICSLPMALKLNDNRLQNPPFLPFDKAQRDVLRYIIRKKTNKPYLIGIAWWSLAVKLGGIDYRDRLIALPLLIETILNKSPAGRENTALVSLQYNKDPNDEIMALAKQRNYPIYCESTINNRFDLQGLASLTMAVDEVVAIHQSIVHFSGALGQKCTVLLPYYSNWQYQASDENLIWYQSVKIHRKNHPDESWESALSRLKL